MTGAWHEVRRPADDELVGFVAEGPDGWRALTVFGGVLAIESGRAAATAVVRERGLASLAERWHWWSRATGGWRVVVPQEASPGRVRVAVGPYSLPGVETAVITTADLDAGDRLTMTPPDGG